MIALAVCALAGPLEGQPAAPDTAVTGAIDPGQLIRHVVLAQKRAEAKLASYTFDQREIETKYASDGRPKEVTRRLYYVFSGEEGDEGSRELVEVDGRPATAEEKRDAAEKDEKGRRKRLERRAADKAKAPPSVTGEDEDPLVGSRRLSDLVSRFDVRVDGEVVEDGRPTYILTFSPRRDRKTKGLGEQALSALAGRAHIDAADFQIKRVEAGLVTPVKVGGGIAAKVNTADVVYEAHPIGRRQWFPCQVDLRLKGKTALFFRLDTGYRFEFGNFQTFAVEVESDAEPVADATEPE